MKLDLFKSELIKLGVNENTKLHITHNSEIISKVTNQRNSFKPNGLWYSIGFDWLDFTINDFDSFYTEEKLYAFILNIKSLNILKISNMEELTKFNDKFKIGEDLTETIDWIEVSNQYDGIEISKYLYPDRHLYMWYYGWDVASGCIWNTEKIKINKINI